MRRSARSIRAPRRRPADSRHFVCRTAKLVTEGTEGMEKIHKRRNGANGDETEKTSGLAPRVARRRGCVRTTDANTRDASGARVCRPDAPTRCRPAFGTRALRKQDCTGHAEHRHPRCLRAGPETGVGASESRISQASLAFPDACDIRLPLAPDRAARGADSRESVSEARCLLRFVSVDSVSPFVNSVPSVTSLVFGSTPT